MTKAQCIHCGTEMFATEPFCPSCGGSQRAQSATPPPDPDIQVADDLDPQERIIAIAKKVALPVISVIVLLGTYMGTPSAGPLIRVLLILAVVYAVVLIARARSSGEWQKNLNLLGAAIAVLALFYVILGPPSPIYRARVAAYLR